MDNRLENIEIQLAYLDDTVDKLNQVVIKQQDQIDVLTAVIKQLKQQQREAATVVRPLSEEVPPPHY